LGAAVAWISSRLGDAGLFLSGAYFLVYGAYCLANFARCQEAHCIITGLGWGGLGLVSVWAGINGLNWQGPLWVAFLAILAIGYGFEYLWAANRGTHALRW